MPEGRDIREAVARPPVEHELKTWPDPFEAMERGDKGFEYRKADRDYRVGDTLVLRKWQPCYPPSTGFYTGGIIRREVTFVLKGPAFGVPEGYCVMSVREVPGQPVSGAPSELRGGEDGGSGAFTPGPWSATAIMDAVAGDEDRDGWTVVARSPVSPRSPQNSAARRQWDRDARLIAAAPDMYAALKELLAEYREWDAPRAGYAETHPAHKARAALTKAEATQ